MLEKLKQRLNADNKIIFQTENPSYNHQDSQLIQDVTQDLALDSPSLLLIEFYTPNTKGYIHNTNVEASIKLVVNNQEGFAQVLTALKTNTHLIDLCFCGYTITDEQAKELGEIVANHPSLQALRLFYCQFSQKGAELFAEGIKKNKQMHSLYLSESTLLDGGLEKIADALKHNSSITIFDYNNLRDPHHPNAQKNPNPGHFSSETRDSILESLRKNQKFSRQRRSLEEKLIVLEQQIKILPQNPERQKQNTLLDRNPTRRAGLLINQIASQLLTKLIPEITLDPQKTLEKNIQSFMEEKQSTLTPDAFEKLYQELSEKNISAVISLCEEIVTIINSFEHGPKYFLERSPFLNRVKKLEAAFYYEMDQIMLLFCLHREYFYSKSDPDVEVNFWLAEKIFNEEDPQTLALLGLQDDRLRYQYVMYLLENNPVRYAKILCKSAYCKLHAIYDDPNIKSLEQLLTVDQILTNEQVFRLHCWISALEVKIATSTQLTNFYSLIQAACAAEEPTQKQFAIEELKSQLKRIKPLEEKFVAQVLLDVLEGKKIAFYSQLRQKKSTDPVKILKLTGKTREKKPTLNLQEFKQAHPTLDNDQIDRISRQVYLNHTLANNLGYGVYEAVFKQPSNENITREHSRILSAERLATIPSTFSYDQMKTILQVEYAALPDNDKKDSPSFFTSYRHRTLEKALEQVFEKENFKPLDNNMIKADQNWSGGAFKILQWIGDIERSFYYKTSKNPDLFSSMKELGRIAHVMIAGNQQLATLKGELEKVVNDLPFLVDTRALKEVIEQISCLDPWSSAMKISMILSLSRMAFARDDVIYF